MRQVFSLMLLVCTYGIIQAQQETTIRDNQDLFTQVLSKHISKMEGMGIIKPAENIYVETNKRMVRFLPEQVGEHTLVAINEDNLQKEVSSNGNEIVYHYINPLSIMNGQLSIVIESCPAVNKLDGVEFDRKRMFVTNTPVVCDGGKCYLQY